jgi:hypothetical protein
MVAHAFRCVTNRIDTSKPTEHDETLSTAASLNLTGRQLAPNTGQTPRPLLDRLEKELGLDHPTNICRRNGTGSQRPSSIAHGSTRCLPACLPHSKPLLAAAAAAAAAATT